MMFAWKNVRIKINCPAMFGSISYIIYAIDAILRIVTRPTLRGIYSGNTEPKVFHVKNVWLKNGHMFIIFVCHRCHLHVNYAPQRFHQHWQLKCTSVFTIRTVYRMNAQWKIVKRNLYRVN